MIAQAKKLQVRAAVERQADTGVDTATGPSSLMVQLAERLVSLNPGLDWAMFAKNGNDVTTLAGKNEIKNKTHINVKASIFISD